MEAKDLAWELFYQKGQVNDYLMYSMLTHDSEEGAHAADQDGWTGDPAYEHRGI